MEIKVWVKNLETGETLEELGTCITNNISRALEMYNDDVWAEKGYICDVAYRILMDTQDGKTGTVSTV